MKETIEVIKCDLCHHVIDTDTIPIEKYHYKYYTASFSNNDDKYVKDTIEKDLCPICVKMIANKYTAQKVEEFENSMEEKLKVFVPQSSSKYLDIIEKAKNDAMDDYHLYNQTIGYQGIDKESYMIGISRMYDKIKNLID